jgi:BON domain
MALLCMAGPAPAQERSNLFNDPFLQLTRGMADCPPPQGPAVTRAEMLEQSHGRVERGTSCYQAGRCRLPNAYLYDKEIITRVQKAVEFDGRFPHTSVWAEGQRRWVWLKGCVQRQEESDALERLVRSIEDVEGVVNELVVRQP